jgi:curved DNA-binding protein CbpA
MTRGCAPGFLTAHCLLPTAYCSFPRRVRYHAVRVEGAPAPVAESMAGQLQKHPLAELVREISSESLSGAVRLARERAKAVIYFDAGELVYAASNLRAYRFSSCARRWNLLTEAQLAAVGETTSDLEAGAALLASGALSREALDALTMRQVSELLCHTLLWTEGNWDFDPRVRLAGEVRAVVNVKPLMVESARRLSPHYVAGRLTNPKEMLRPETQVPDDINLLPAEAFVLSRLDAPLSVRDLVIVSGLPEEETLRAAYTLALGGFLRRERWPQALTDEEKSRAHALESAQARPAQAPEPEMKVEPKVETKVTTTPQAPAPEEKRAEEARPEDLFDRLKLATNYYQRLGVVRTASAADIKRAYHGLAKRYHPDRFRREADAALLARIESGFAQIAQAYETLKDSSSRATYDSKLMQEEAASRAARPAKLAQDEAGAGVKPSPPANGQSDAPASFRAKEKFQQGLSALQQGNNAFAISSLGEAARLDPTQPRYRAYLGQAMASDERLRRNAEAELKAAIALDANNATYRVMLAELYTELGLLRRAQSELERALALEPQNKLARRLLDKVKGKG